MDIPLSLQEKLPNPSIQSTENNKNAKD